MSGIGLVIFDCDGVLVDSEAISVEILRTFIGEAGGSVSEEVAYRRFLGRSVAAVSEILASDFGVAMTDADLDRMRAEVQARFARELKPVPGVRAMLEALSLPRCVASSGSPERILFSLTVTGLLGPLAPHLFSAAMVENGKPAPDLFLHAARIMGVAPNHCLVVEDSPAGIEAAHAAGMHVAAFTGGLHARGEMLRAMLAPLKPDFIFDDMSKLPDLITRLNRGSESGAKAS